MGWVGVVEVLVFAVGWDVEEQIGAAAFEVKSRVLGKFVGLRGGVPVAGEGLERHAGVIAAVGLVDGDHVHDVRAEGFLIGG